MKIKYEFATGEEVEIEVSEEISEISVQIDKKIHNSDRRETRRQNSISDLEERGTQFADKGDDSSFHIEKQEMNESLSIAFDKLLPQQRELIKKVFFEGKTIVAVAKDLGITKQACNNRLNKIYSKLKKYL